MHVTSRSLAFAALFLSAGAGPAASQEASEGPAHERPTVFFDCDGRNCRSDYYRTEIDWVNWVRDRRDGDVHLIMTSVSTGAGGMEYQLDFLGLGPQAGYEDRLVYQTLPTDTEREALDGITHIIGLGLARFATAAGYRGIVSVEGRIPGATEVVVTGAQVDDPWDLWVFRVGGSANLDGESARQTTRLDGSLSASRVSPTWKLSTFWYTNFNRVEFDLEDGTFTDTRTDWGLYQVIAYSLGQHWSIGVDAQSARSTRFNQDFRVEVKPAIEYSFFPYEEATRRSLTVLYKVGGGYRDYLEETVFGESEELRYDQSLEIELSQRETWGESSVSIEGSHYLHDLDRHRLSLNGELDFRIVRGFSINLEGDIAWVDDQIYLSAGGVSDEQALLSLRQQATNFDYSVRVGFSFQFGSIFNNVVNNRFRSVGIGRFFRGGGGGGGR
jgi:hypothetical protein